MLGIFSMSKITIKRIVTNIECAQVDKAKAFYQDILGLDILMDLDWIQTYGLDTSMPIQISIASEGGSGAVVPDISIEVENLDIALRVIEESGYEVEYGPKQEPWGVRRFFVRDPFGKLLNIMQHV